MIQTKEYAQYLGKIMRDARNQHKITIHELAITLRVSAETLKKYESGALHVPLPILERIFIMGYGIMRLNKLNRHYHYMTRVREKYGTYNWVKSTDKVGQEQ